MLRSRSSKRSKPPKVSLRLLTEADVTGHYLAWLRQPEVRRWIRTKPPTLGGLRRYVRAQLQNPHVRFWAILADGWHVGNLKTEHQRGREGHVAVLGLLIGDSRMRGRGIGPAAIRHAVRWCFRHWKVSGVAAGVHPFNTSSMKAFEKSGFKVADRDPPRVWLQQEKP